MRQGERRVSNEYKITDKILVNFFNLNLVSYCYGGQRLQ